MLKRITKFRGFSVTKREILADVFFLIVSFSISLLAIYIFDIHWSLYPGETIFPPSKHVGIEPSKYYFFTFAGTILFFIILKLMMLGIKEEEKEMISKALKKR
ncbi:MAG TPA: hypothetical protein VHA12_00430 [Candidatus Nanoarchaeia archaeon]|nr:hypothetical protein [Candidatus Nanoarchaeia archaeon]